MLQAITFNNSHWRDYYQLTKPRVVLLLVLTAAVGMGLAPNELQLTWYAQVLTLLGIGLMSAAAAAINQVLDQRIDGQMRRTQYRPLVRGAVTTKAAYSFALLLALSGFACIVLFANSLTAWLTLASLVGYAVVYTAFLKRATPQNIVIGGLAGAMPPLLGWVALTGQLTAEPWLLVMIVFTWTPPHFWALAIARKADYEQAGIPMLPVTHGIEFTKTCIVLYATLLNLVCLWPVLIGMSGTVYLVASLLLNGYFTWLCVQLKFDSESRSAMWVFRYSISYLMLLFVALFVDKWIG